MRGHAYKRGVGARGLGDPGLALWSAGVIFLHVTCGFLKKKLHNKYLFIGDQKDVGDNIKKDNKLINFINIKRDANTKVYLKKCFELALN